MPRGWGTIPRMALSGVTYERWTARAERPLLVLAGVFLLVLALPVAFPAMPRIAARIVSVADLVIWALFAADYLVRLTLVEQKWRFVRTHLLDLAAVALPALRPLRLLRLVAVGQMLAKRSRRNIAAQGSQLVAGAGVLLVLVAAVTVLDAERTSPDANIKSIGDALWWAATTITTVGYGDRYPTTGIGRVVAVGLMVFGIALLGVLTASIAAWFVTLVEQTEQQETETLERRLDGLERKLDRVLDELDRR